MTHITHMTKSYPKARMHHDPRASARGFTLLEIMVAVAAGLLIVLAISSLFASAGATIGAGRRLSEFSRKGALIEQRIREDFRNLSRDGYMVIRHAVADDGPNPGGTFLPWRVPAFPDDPNPRLRRVDEIMFFTEGEFTTARAPLAPGFTGEGNVARVYYGHGAIADFAADEALFIPEYDMGLAGGSANLQVDLGLLGQPGRPNEFAEDWILIRHQTVLVQPRSADQSLPTAFLDPFDDPQGNDALLMGDGDRQIAFQPAMSSIFRHVNYPIGQIASDPLDNMLREQSQYDRGRYLVVQSNLFDIATTDLREIRQRVMTMHDGQDFGPDYVPPADPDIDPLDGRRGIPILPVPPFVLEDSQDLLDFPTKGYTPYLQFSANNPDLTGERANLLFNGIHAWMRNGMPTDGGIATDTEARGDDVEQGLYSIRMHVEPSPPELLTVLDPDEYDPKTLEAADRLNEQLMLTASNLGVHVGDFQIEWTFGQTYLATPFDPTDPRNGELIWYGGHTLVDVDGDGLADNVEFSEYQSDNLFSPEHPALAFDRRAGVRIERATGGTSEHRVHDFLIHGPRSTRDINNDGDADRPNPLYSYFGWDDPTYAPDPNATDPEVASLPWAWPKMLRITVSLIDSADPTIEQSFQFVIELDSEN